MEDSTKVNTQSLYAKGVGPANRNSGRLDAAGAERSGSAGKPVRILRDSVSRKSEAVRDCDGDGYAVCPT